MKLTMENVKALMMDCMFKTEEIVDGKAPEGFIEAHGVMIHAGFHPGRLESHREDVKSMLLQLPKDFMKSGGGGMTFLNACSDKNGHQWGEHRDMDALFALGIGLGYVSFPMPRSMWSILPGGMPYVAINDTRDEELARPRKEKRREQKRIHPD